MNSICIDIGNTAIKVGVFNQNQLLDTYYNMSAIEIVRLCNELKDHKIIVSSVNANFKHIYNLIENKDQYIELSHSLKIPITNKYTTPHTLGTDRLAAVVGATVKLPNKNLLVIQTGTCFTFDYIDSQLNYWGGAISPGLLMRFEALNKFTDKLPLVTMNENFEELTGNSTESSILSGVINGCVCELEGIIDKYKEKTPDLAVVLTGGWSKYFESKINRAKFAFQDLVLVGLNKILIHSNE
jgi:type III pantothenate kinase